MNPTAEEINYIYDCIENGWDDMLNEFLNTRNLDLNSESFVGMRGGFICPLDNAICFKNVGICKILLRHGANPNQPYFNLHTAINTEIIEIVELLVRFGAYLNIRDQFGMTPIELAVSNHLNNYNNGNSLEIAQFLINYGIEMSDEFN